MFTRYWEPDDILIINQLNKKMSMFSLNVLKEIE